MSSLIYSGLYGLKKRLFTCPFVVMIVGKTGKYQRSLPRHAPPPSPQSMMPPEVFPEKLFALMSSQQLLLTYHSVVLIACVS